MIPNFNNINFTNNNNNYAEFYFSTNQGLNSDNQIERVKSKLKKIENFIKIEFKNEFDLNKRLLSIGNDEYDINNKLDRFILNTNQSIDSSKKIIEEKRKLLNLKLKELNPKNMNKKEYDADEKISKYLNNNSKKDLELFNKY